MANVYLRKILNFISSIILTDIAICAIVALICRLGWRTLDNFPTGIFIAGTILIIAGAFIYIGSSGREGLFDSYYKYAKDSEEAYKRTIINIELLEGSTNFALFVSFAGTFLILLSFLL
jgi:hypothetical protein